MASSLAFFLALEPRKSFRVRPFVKHGLSDGGFPGSLMRGFLNER